MKNKNIIALGIFVLIAGIVCVRSKKGAE